MLPIVKCLHCSHIITRDSISGPTLSTWLGAFLFYSLPDFLSEVFNSPDFLRVSFICMNAKLLRVGVVRQVPTYRFLSCKYCIHAFLRLRTCIEIDVYLCRWSAVCIFLGGFLYMFGVARIGIRVFAVQNRTK